MWRYNVDDEKTTKHLTFNMRWKISVLEAFLNQKEELVVFGGTETETPEGAPAHLAGGYHPSGNAADIRKISGVSSEELISKAKTSDIVSGMDKPAIYHLQDKKGHIDNPEARDFIGSSSIPAYKPSMSDYLSAGANIAKEEFEEAGYKAGNIYNKMKDQLIKGYENIFNEDDAYSENASPSPSPQNQ